MGRWRARQHGSCGPGASRPRNFGRRPPLTEGRRGEGVPMPEFAARAESFWAATVADDPTRYPALQGDLEVDVAIVGGGIVGLTAALLLQRAGRRVAVLEARLLARQVTGRSTAKITSQHGLIYHKLETSFGAAGARAYGAANQAGLEQILRL